MHVCLHVLYKAYFVVIPSKPFSRGSLVKNGLIVNKTTVVLLLVLWSLMSPINLVNSNEVAAMD